MPKLKTSVEVPSRKERRAIKKLNERCISKIRDAEFRKGYKAHKDMVKDANVIGWCDYTHNWWTGCTRYSESCANCYAFNIDKRFGRDQFWGKGVARRMTKTWPKLLWRDREARKLGIKILVFANSMSDFFDEEIDDGWREIAFGHIAKTTNTIFQLNTKRAKKAYDVLKYKPKEIRDKIWIGFTVENQKRADERMPYLNEIDVAKRYISSEPLLSHIDFKLDVYSNIDWIIGGEESGWKKRPTLHEWKTSMRDQCHNHNVAFYWKQNTDSNGRYSDKLIDGRKHCEFPDYEAAFGFPESIAA